MGVQERRMARQAEEQVLPPRRFPGVAALSLAAGLIFGGDYEELFAGTVFMVADGVVGRVGLVDTYDFEVVKVVFHMRFSFCV